MNEAHSRIEGGLASAGGNQPDEETAEERQRRRPTTQQCVCNCDGCLQVWSHGSPAGCLCEVCTEVCWVSQLNRPAHPDFCDCGHVEGGLASAGGNQPDDDRN